VKSGEPGYLGAGPLDPKVAGDVLSQLNFDLATYHAFVPIDVPADTGRIIPDIALESGRTQHLRVTDAEGRPVKDTWVYCLQGGSSHGEALSGDELAFLHDNPGKALTVMIVHQSHSLGAAVDLKGDEPDPMRVILQPTGTVAGRLVDEDGKPRAGASVVAYHHIRFRGGPIMCDRSDPMTTGPDGRFRITHLVPGVPYTVQVLKKNETDTANRAEGNLHGSEWTVNPGEEQDWGDVRVEAF
jgi:Carboxypeptidase regulatory-like domain